MMPPGQLRNLSVQKHFEYEQPDAAKTCLIAICKHCGGYKKAKGMTQEHDHLENCKKYKEWEHANNEKLHQTKLEKHTISQIDPAWKAKIDQKLAYTIYKTGSPFTLFEDSAWIGLFAEFGYKPPSASQLSTRLLDEAYEKIEEGVNYQLRASPMLNMITDESTDISGNRIINTCAMTSSGDCFYISNIEAEAGKLGADELADHAISTAEQITNGDLSKVVSFTMDTCATQWAVWKRFEKQLNTKHIFTVPCDSHGLQLIFKDLLQ